MPKIQFVKPYSTITVSKGTVLMKGLLTGNMPVASSCHGDGVCGKCMVKVISGAENLTKRDALELEILKKNKAPPDGRISCQCQVIGDVCVDTSYW